MKKFIIGCIVVLILGGIVSACSGETTSYYIDYNGNGREDFGEGVWYEDKNGTHFYDWSDVRKEYAAGLVQFIRFWLGDLRLEYLEK